MLGRLGRRLAYLPIDGKRPADPRLVRFGKHLRFLADRAKHPGQQVVLVLTELLAAHWVTDLSQLEQQSLPALDAAIEPSRLRSGFAAAVAAEDIEIGPVPSGDDDNEVDGLLTNFNALRSRSTDESLVARLRAPIERHYEALVDRGWALTWKCLERERWLPEAQHVSRRWADDGEAIDRHMEWTVVIGGRRRVQETNAQAARTLRSWEQAQALLVAEEAIDDPIRMIPYFLANRAVGGTVIEIDLEHRVKLNGRNQKRPLVKVELAEPCALTADKEIYWTGAPSGPCYLVVERASAKKGTGWHITLEHQTNRVDSARPQVGDHAVFSVHDLSGAPPLTLPDKIPWTHAAESAPDGTIEEPTDERGWE